MEGYHQVACFTVLRRYSELGWNPDAVSVSNDANLEDAGGAVSSKT